MPAPGKRDTELAIAYMAYLIQVRGELQHEVMYFMDSLEEFEGLYMGDDEFELLCRLWAKKHPEAYTMIIEGRMDRNLKRIIDDEWAQWQRDFMVRTSTGDYGSYEPQQLLEDRPYRGRRG